MPPLVRKARGMAALVAVVSAFFWLLWYLDSALVIRLSLGGPSMKPNTAASILCCAIALWMAASNRTRFILAPLGVCLLFNGMTLAEYLSGMDLGIDRLLAHAAVTDAAPPGRTALGSVIAFLALAAALFALARRRPIWTDLLGLIAAAVGLFASVMHVFGDPLLLTSAAFTIALQTALCILILAAGVLAVNPNGRVLELLTSTSAGGKLARRLVPLSLFLPIVFAWLRYFSMRAGVLHDAAGLELLAIAFILMLTAITWWSTSSLDRADTARAALSETREAALRAAEEANQAKDEFLAMLGHELRNPLAPIFAVLDRMKDIDQTAFVREREILERQSRHLERLVGDLMDVSRIARKSLAIERAPLSMNEVLDAALETLTPRIASAHLALVRESSGGSFWVNGDRGRLVQVVVNLLANACTHTPPGGTITLRLERSASDVVCLVRDTGGGIAPELLPRVFENFVQAPQDIERQRGGLGLGLAIVRNIAELHGGTASIESPGKGMGTTARVCLPEIPAPASAAFAREKTRAPAPAEKPAALTLSSSFRVLVVDDNEDAVEMLSLLLSDSGYISEKAFDGEEALRVAKEFEPHLVLLDLGLPKLSGFEVARRLRADPARRGIRIVAVTGFGQPRDREAAAQAGIDHLVVKPLEFARLQSLMNALLETTLH